MALAVLLPFLAFSTWVTWSHGYWGFVPVATDGEWGTQVFLDLVISLTIAWGGLQRLGRDHGVPTLPYIATTPLLGCISPLVFLLHVAWRRRGSSGNPTA